MWHGRMDANWSTPSHIHDAGEVALFLNGSDRVSREA